MLLFSHLYPCPGNYADINQNSQVVKKKLNLKNLEIFLFEVFLFIIQGLKFSQTCCFHKTIVQNRIKKTFPDKSNDKTFKETKRFHYAIALILHENQNATKKSL